MGGFISQACFLQLVNIFAFLFMSTMLHCNAADISIQVGSLAAVRSDEAIGFMSGITMDKGKWLQLSSTSVHPEAFMRFMVLGAPGAAVIPNSSWDHHADSDVLRKGGLLATRNASIAEFSSHQAIQEVGNLDITAWMLGFACVDSNISPCKSLAPVAIVNRVDETSGSTCLEFTIVWEKLALGSSSVVTNTLTAKLINASKEEKTIDQGAQGQFDKFSVNVLRKETEACSSTANMQFAVRSSLDATYNLGPYECYQLINPKLKSNAGIKEYLLVLGMQNPSSADDQAVDGNGDAVRSSYSGGDVQDELYGGPTPAAAHQVDQVAPLQACITSWLQKYYKNVTLGECQDSHLLIANHYNSDRPQDVTFAACPNLSSTTCWQSDSFLKGNMITECDDMLFHAFKTSIDQADQPPKNMDEHNFNGFNYILGSSVYGLPAGNLCEIAGNIQNGGQSTSSDLAHPFGYLNNPVAVDAEILGGLFTELNNRYAQAHTDALELKRGPSQDFLTTMIALVGAAISVLTATIPLTNFLLQLLIRTSGTLHGAICSYIGRYSKIVMLSLVNMVIAFVCYGAVVAMIVSEKQRAKAFETWAVIGESVMVNEMGLELQALYVVHGKSVYKSKQLMLIWVLMSILVVLVGGMSYQRCRDVLKKLKLIKQLKASGFLAGHRPPWLDDYKAVEMGEAEYQEFLHDLECQRLGTSAANGSGVSPSGAAADDPNPLSPSPQDMVDIIAPAAAVIHGRKFKQAVNAVLIVNRWQQVVQPAGP